MATTLSGTIANDLETDQPGTTPAGQAGSSAAGQSAPDKRRYNPFGNYPVVTYQLSLYMITPDSYDEFNRRDRRFIDLAGPTTGGKGAYLIAQSGGINNTSQQRAPGFNLDYYIDELRIKQAIDPKATGTSSATTEISFNIIEPYGFSFVTNLKKTADAIGTYSTTKGIKDLRNSSRQFFILGVKFLGYNQDGAVASETDGMYDRYWDISITGIRTKIDGRATTYNIKAAPLTIQSAMGAKRGLIDLGASPKGMTVEDLLLGEDQASGKFGIFTKLNYDQQTTPGIGEPNTYNVVFIGPYGDQIKNALVASDADRAKSKLPMSDSRSTAEVNDRVAVKAVPDINSQQISFKPGTPILQAIQQIISQSSYVEDALKTVTTSELEPNPKTKTPDEVVPDTNKKVRWFNVSYTLSNPRYDSLVNDFAFDITYVIQSYDIPVILMPNANNTTPYYGPVKRYDYWYTGKNSEILRYEQNLDNLFYNVVLTTRENADTKRNEASIPEKRNQRTGVQPQGKTGTGVESYNEVLTQLISPGDYAEAKIEILGDPDWLMQPTPGNPNTTYNQFYGPDGYSVNPNTGQVFIEIDFKEAVDYNTGTGVMDVNDKILFWDYPPDIRNKIKGISYRVITVLHQFRGGKFTQELDCKINVFGNSSGTFPSAGAQRATESPAGATTSQSTTTESTGLKSVPPSSASVPTISNASQEPSDNAPEN